MKTRKETTDRLRRILGNLSMEYINDLDNAEREREECRKAQESGDLVCMVLVGEQNAKVMLQCMRDVRRAILFMRDEERFDVEPWQLAGINAMFDQCNADCVIPFDIGTAVCGILGVDYFKDLI